jgi:hypothetical protein
VFIVGAINAACHGRDEMMQLGLLGAAAAFGGVRRRSAAHMCSAIGRLVADAGAKKSGWRFSA